MAALQRLEEYGGEEGDEYGSWVLLEPTAGSGEVEGDTPASAPVAAGSVKAVAVAGGGFRHVRRFLAPHS